MSFEAIEAVVDLHPRVLVVDDGLNPSAVASTAGRRIRALLSELKELNYKVLEAVSFPDALANVQSDASIVLLVVDWTLGKNTSGTHQQATDLLLKARSRNAKLPIFLSLDRNIAHSIPLKVMQLVNEFVWILEDSPRFIAGRANAAVKRYLNDLLPPLAGAMVRYATTNEYSWAAPGHQGGVAFTKNPAGRVFFDFLGENLFRSDMGIERANLGSMLDHTGPMGAAEKYISYVFGSHRSYSGVNGSSGSNRVIFSACVQANRVALCDRNCHKSIEQGLVTTGGLPQYLVPTRNRYGIIGPIPPSHLTPSAIQAAIADNPLVARHAPPDQRHPVYAVVTNCTYDGLCYNATRAEELLDRLNIDRIHFDEAWFAYARFNSLYADRYAMRGDPKSHDPVTRPTVFATQSTHKLLAALSQATFIHVRNGRRAIDHSVFNEAYQLHTTTSPLYAILASNDIAACMMDHGSGKALTDECIREAVAFRQSLMRAYHEIRGNGNSSSSNSSNGKGGGQQQQGQGVGGAGADWFFHPWNAFDITDPETGKTVRFDHAKPDLLATDARCWLLQPGAGWHGFEGLEDGWCMLDPIKVGIVCPGMSPDGSLHERGVPAPLVTAYLEQRGIVVARTTDFIILFLFSIGITKGKWGTLLSALLSFKKDYDRNEPVSRALPQLYERHRDRYRGLGLKDLGDEMFKFKVERRQGDVLHEAYDRLPRPALTPREAFERLMAGESEPVGLSELEGRVAAVSVIPYPPGIPMVMAGEVVGPAQRLYLETMEAVDTAFPGFEVEIQGVEKTASGFRLACLRDHDTTPASITAASSSSAASHKRKGRGGEEGDDKQQQQGPETGSSSKKR